MKLLTLTFAGALVLTSPGALLASPEATATLELEQTQLIVNHGSTTTVSYGTLNSLQVLKGLSLPVRTALVPLNPGESLENIAFSGGDSTNVGNLAPQKPIWDGVTSSENAYASIEREHNTFDRLGGRPVTVVGEIVAGEQRYADLLLFPVTVDSAGALWFHSSLGISIGDRAVTAGNLLPRHETLRSRSDARDQSATSSGPDYLVVTSSSLAQALQPLVRYKNETGYRAILETIESILASYPGRDDPEKLRERLKTFYADGGRYVLLAGDETVLPIRYVYPNLTSEMPPLDQMQVCDLYFADVTGDWDADGDGIWGGKYTDDVDVIPELLVGRLPINSSVEAANYTAKLIQYETDPGEGDRDYLERAFFFASDQMRDYDQSGQHSAVARSYPSWFGIDTVSAVERATGDDPNPSTLTPSELAPIFAEGFGIVNVIAHGRSDGFVLKSSGYNDWPKTYFLTDNVGTDHGRLETLTASGKPSFYYSLGCNNGGFDMDQPPMSQTNPCMVQDLIGGPAGAVGVVAYSRWGWISSSYLLQAAFFDSLFAHPERSAVEALYASKAAIYYYRDLVYGLNFFGDPSLRVYARRPEKPEIRIETDGVGLGVTVSRDGAGLANCQVVLSQNGEVLYEHTSDASGQITIEQNLSPTSVYRLTARTEGSCVTVADFIPALVTDVDDESSGVLPIEFALHQNYPNPFNPNTTISYDLPTASRVRLAVYNVLGQTMVVLDAGYKSAGRYTFTWDGCDHSGASLPSGVYFYRLESERFESVRKMILLK